MKNLMVVAIFILVSIVKSMAQDSCNCLVNLNYVVDKVSHNYAGFKDKVNPKTTKTYNNLVDSLRKVAENTNILRGCYDIINNYCLFFYDKHLQFRADIPSEPSASKGEDDKPNLIQTKWTKTLIINYLEKRKKALKPMEGIWTTEGYEVGIVFNKKNKTYDAIVLTAKNPKWKEGTLKFRSTMINPNLFETIYTKGDFQIEKVSLQLIKNYIDIPRYGTWKKILPISQDTLSEEQKAAEMGAVQFKYVDDSTVYIALKSCDIELKPVLAALMLKNADKLKSIPYWIIDFRDNAGGDTGTYESLLPYLYTRLGISKGSKNWLTPEHIEKWEILIAKYRHLMDSSAIDYITKRIDYGKAHPNSWYDDQIDTTKYDKVLPFPKKVAVLRNVK